MELSERKMQTTQVLMTREIEDFIERHVKETQDALDELRISFEMEIKNVDGMSFLFNLKYV
jgi:hypothetical protein